MALILRNTGILASHPFRSRRMILSSHNIRAVLVARRQTLQLSSRSLRAVAQLSTTTTSASSTVQQPIVELREYTVRPETFTSYVQETNAAGALRRQLAPQLRWFSYPETGGPLLVATHAYYFAGGHAERDQIRAGMVANEDWKAYLAATAFPSVQLFASNIFVEAPFLSQERGDQVLGLKDIPKDHLLLPNDNNDNINNNNKDCILELRRYKLKLGYDTVPQFLEYYQAGLPSKLTAPGTDPTTSLVTLLSCDVGRLNEVIEVWRHGNGTSAMEQSRMAARGAAEWRSAIANIADLAIEFTSTIHKPAAFSPLK